jgi:hypothetical protein
MTFRLENCDTYVLATGFGGGVADMKTIRTCRNSLQGVLGDTHRRGGDRNMVGSRTCRSKNYLCGGPIAKNRP